MFDMDTVLVSDPDGRSRRATAAALRYGGYAVAPASTPAQAASLLRRRPVAAVVLDVAEDSLVDAVTALRAQTDVPIVVVSPSADSADKVAVLDAGADDYLTKPVDIEELLSRLRVLLRRVPRPMVGEVPIVTSDFTIHVRDRRWVRSDGAEIRLTPIEWRLVEVLTAHAGHLVPQADLLQRVWGPKAVDKPNYLRVQVAGIRRKVEPDPAHPRYFVTAPGLGLRFDPEVRDRLQPG
jgi:two-component system, OmpR family, KDP operon response regulator KdpE